MKRPCRIALALFLAATGPVMAGEPVALSVGGAFQPSFASAGEPQRLGLFSLGGASAGFASSPRAGLQAGSYLAWGGAGARFDANLRPSLDGRLSTDLGAEFGARPSELGTSYGLRLGAAWGGDRFSVNPSSRLGLAEVTNQDSSANVTVRVNRAVTPNLSVVGTAEARRSMIAAPDAGSAAQTQLLLGAAVGVRF